ncbi:MAG TPA: hypothetical protein VGW09_01005 [Nitrososphaeraceae archaeon]|nr:hypothetical protein [Nitrososphaeraceae archaeon]
MYERIFREQPECCGMRLRASPANREYKKKVRDKKKLTAHLVESLEAMSSRISFLNRPISVITI